MSLYFGHHAISNSNLNELEKMVDGREDPENLEEIFELGTLNHEALLEQRKAKLWLQEKMDTGDQDQQKKAIKDYRIATEMADTVLKDEFCRKLILMRDFRREFEWYLSIDEVEGVRSTMGFDYVRCKTDGDSRIANCIFEYKGLALSSENAFNAAIEHHCYDQAAYWYLNVTGLKRWVIAGVSKINTKKIFKRIVDRNHKWYASGEQKVEAKKKIYRQYVGPVS